MSRPQDTVFGYRVAIVMARRRETFKEFAATCRVTVASLQVWLSIDTEPLLGHALGVAIATGYDLDDLCDPMRVFTGHPRRPDAPVDYDGIPPLFPARLAEAIASEFGLTVTQLADDISVDRSSASRWLAGRAHPRITSAQRAAWRLGVRLHYLAGGES